MNSSVINAQADLTFIVDEAMIAVLEGRIMHRVCSTYWLCYYAECVGRRIIEPYFDEGENAVGNALTLKHHAMAPVGATLRVHGDVCRFTFPTIECAILIWWNDTLIAEATHTQTVLAQQRIEQKITEAYQRLSS